MARDDFNPQDAFAKLIELCRLGQVGKPTATYRPSGIKMQPHRPRCDPNVPCFYVGERAGRSKCAHNDAHAAVRGELSMALKGWKPKE